MWRLALVVLFSLYTGRANADIDPETLYGSTILFDVIRNGDVVGQHQTSFSREGDNLVVSSKMSLDISVLVFPVYSFSYQSREFWRGRRLIRLDATVNDDGEIHDISAQEKGGALVVSGPDGEARSVRPLIATNHWNVRVIEEDRVLNTLTGKINFVTIRASGEELLQFENGAVRATRYDYAGALKDTSVWYDRDGRWVKLMFKGRDGSMIEYRCKTCGADS